MNRETLENNIKNNYKIVQNYLNGDPWAEWFLNSLADLQTDFANYLIEVLKTKKYVKDDYKKSNIYQWHIKWWEEKYINNERLEHIISNKVLWKKISINSLLDEWIKKLEKLFNTQKSFEETLKSWKLQSIQLDKVILPSDDLSAPIIWTGKWFKEKELNQNKLWLFISILRNLWIYDDDLIIYSGKIENNMMRENTYYAIFIPRINKTVFLNTGYWEATFICEWEVSIDKMTSLWKEKLQSELWAIRIKFFENNIEWWENELKNTLLWKWWKPGKKINKEWMKKIRDKTNRLVELDKLRLFYEEHKNNSFIDSEWNEFTIEHLFSKLNYYKENYKIINEQFSPEVNFPGNPSNYYNIRWNEFLKKLWIEVYEYEIMSLENLKLFYSEHKDDTFKDSNWKISTVKKLFSNFKYYLKNYKELNKNLNIKLPGNPTHYYNNITRGEIQQELWIDKDFREIISFEDLKIFLSKHWNDVFTDHENKPSNFENLFSRGWIYYSRNYKIINKNINFNIKLPSEPTTFYDKPRNNLLQELWIDKDSRKIMSLNDLKNFYTEHKNDSFLDSDWNEFTIEELFSRGLDYYYTNYRAINNKFLANKKLPGKPTNYYNTTRSKIQKTLWINKNFNKIISLKDLKNFYAEHKDDSFIDSDWRPSTIEKLFSTLKYYQKNYEIINEKFSLKIKLSANPKLYYRIWWTKIKLSLWIL